MASGSLDRSYFARHLPMPYGYAAWFTMDGNLAPFHEAQPDLAEHVSQRYCPFSELICSSLIILLGT